MSTYGTIAEAIEASLGRHRDEPEELAEGKCRRLGQVRRGLLTDRRQLVRVKARRRAGDGNGEGLAMIERLCYLAALYRIVGAHGAADALMLAAIELTARGASGLLGGSPR